MTVNTHILCYNYFNTIMSFDYGTKTIGIAIGQNITYTAQPLTFIKTKKNIFPLNTIKNLILEWEPNILIVGLPITLNEKYQNIIKKIILFSKNLKTYFNIPVYLHDERFTTSEAKLRLLKTKKKIRKQDIDMISAVIILESWLLTL